MRDFVNILMGLWMVFWSSALGALILNFIWNFRIQ